ncbi:hypothetical protein GCM10023093_26180 [Nemorincola caseinilytica]|uniref:Secretion system C-terminal sorting domain-containing protein n=1 Tax=Nemorincola caseinilytica TaxID=2054315 RepID=A0ABP8NNF4_9BACT
MKKLYLLLVVCLCAIEASATTYTNIASRPLNVAANWTTNGLAAGGTAATDFATPGDVFILANAPATTSLTTDWTLGAVTLNITRAVTFNGGRAVILNGTTATANNTLTFSAAGNTLTVGNGTDATTLSTTGRITFSVATATLTINALATVDMQATGSTLAHPGTIIANNGTLKTASTSATALPASKDYTNGGVCTGTVSFYSAAAQTIPAGTYYDVSTSGGGIKTIGISTVRHELNAGTGTSVRPSAITTVVTGTGATITGSGTVIVTATSATALTTQYAFTTYTLTGLTVDFNSTTAQSIAASATVGNYGNLSITTTTAGLKTLLGDITVLGNVSVNATTAHNALDASASNYQITLGGNWTNKSTSGSTALFVGRAGTVTFNGTGVQNIGVNGGTSYPNFYNLTNSNTTNVLNLNSNVNLAGSMTINAGGTVNAGSSTMTVGGNWTNNGTFTAGTGTVNFNSTPSHSVTGIMTGANKFNNLTCSSATPSVISFSGNVEVAGNLTMSGTGTFSAPPILQVGGNFAHTAGTFTANGGEVILNGTATQTLPGSVATVFKTLTIDNTTPRTLTSNGIITIGNAFTLPQNITWNTTTFAVTDSSDFTNNGTYTATTQALKVLGNFINGNTGSFTSGTGTTAVTITGDLTNNGTFNGSTGTVILNGTGTRNITGSMTSPSAFNNLTFNNAAGIWNFSNDATVKGAFTITTGTVNAPAGTLYIGGNFAHTAGTFNANGGTVDLNGAANQSIPGTLATTFRTLIISGSSRTITVNRALTVGAALTIPAGITVTAAANAITDSSDLINNGTYTTTTQALKVMGDLTNTGTFTSSSGTAAVTVNGNFTNSGTYTSSGAGVISIGGNYANTGTFTANTGTVKFAATTAGRTLTGNMTGTSKFRSLTFVGVGGTWSFGGDAELGGILTITSGTVTAPSGTLKVAGNFAKATAGVFTHNNGTVEMNGTAAQSIPGATITFHNLSIANTTATVTANAAMTVNNMFTSAAGSTLNMSTRALSGTYDATGHNGTLLTQATSSAVPTGKTWGGTVNFNATAAQAVARGTYNNLTLTGTTAVKTLGAGAMTVNGDFTLISTTGITALAGALDVNGNIRIKGTTGNNILDASASNYQINCGGNWIDSSTTATDLFNERSGTVIFDGSSAQRIYTIAGSVLPTFYNVTINNTNSPLAVNTNTNISGTLSLAANTVLSPDAGVVFNTLAAAGTVSGSGTLQVTRTAATADYSNQYKFTTNTLGTITVDYAGAGAQDINTLTYGTLKTSGSGTKTATGNITLNSALNIGSGTLLDLGNSYTLGGSASTFTVDGTLQTAMPTTTGTAIPSGKTWSGTGTVAYNAATGQQTIVSGTYNNLTLGNSSNTDTIIATVTVNGTLTLGKLSLGNNNIILGSSATIWGASASNYIVTNGTGRIRKQFIADGSFTYPTGDAGGHYSPIQLNMSGSGYSGAYADAGTVAAVHPSNASANNYLGRYWTIALNGITAPSYSVTGTYVSADVNGFATSILSAVYTGSLPWVEFSGADSVANTVTATGLSNTTVALSGTDAVPVASIWNGTTWSNGTPGSATDVTITSTVVPTPATFSVHDLTISSGVSLNTGTTASVTITGDLINNGKGLSGTGTVIFAKAGTSAITGDTVAFGGTIRVNSGCTLQTNEKLRLSSRATYTGVIGESYGTISGRVIVERYNAPRRAYRFFAHPYTSAISLSQLTDMIDITGGSVANGYTATPSNSPSAFWFNPLIADTVTVGTNSGWVAFSGPLTNTNWNRYQMARVMVRGAKGQGLTSASYTPLSVILSTKGEVNQGTQVITLTKGTNSQFVTCGNPYPCGVQMSTVTKGTSINANYTVWDPSLGTAGAYVSVPFGMSYVLPPFAAISTTATDNTDNTLTFHESDKVSTFTTLFRSAPMPSWVELQIADSNKDWDRVLLHLDGAATATQDATDAVKLSNPDLDLYTLSADNARLAIDARPYSADISIPLGIASMEYGSYVIRTGMYGITADNALYLHDKYLNRTVRLKEGTEYWFDITADPASQGEQRFELNTSSVNALAGNTDLLQLSPNPAQGSVQLSYHDIAETGQVTITNVTGQVVYADTVPAGTGNITISLQNIPAGIYLVKLTSGNVMHTQKLIKN